jgi:signal transduction histidine kinase
MNLDKIKRRAWHAWLFVGALFVLCGILGFLQYRWTGEVSQAARERLRASLQSSLLRLSQEFNSEIAASCRAIVPLTAQAGAGELETELAARFNAWAKTSRHGRLFDRVGLAVPGDGGYALRGLDLGQGTFAAAEWPAAWTAFKERLEARASPDRRQPRGLPFRGPFEGAPLAIEVPLMEMLPHPGGEPGPFFRRETPWLILGLNLQYLRDELLPDLILRHLGTGGDPDYQVQILTRSNPPIVIYESDPGQTARMAGSADASINLLDLRHEQLRRWWGPPPGGRDWDAPGRPGPGPMAGFGRWQMLVRHRAGSLDAVVARATWRNLAVTGGVLLLMVATAAALMRFTRRAQRLAQLQMNFVAGVSHELRTPLTVIHTAAYNLRGKVGSNPAQVERYGALIQQESGRLKELVEQVLSFAGAEAGFTIKEPKPVCLEGLIEETMESAKPLIEASHCVIEKRIEAGLPVVQGDRLALKHALGNLLSNAAKYGAKGGNWIGVFASRAIGGQPAVEIRIADRGPGIPPDEKDQVFDPFFRGRLAIHDQIHGTGLGLNLAKKIVEAHGGSIEMKSEPTKGTEFTVRLPAAADGAQA